MQSQRKIISIFKSFIEKALIPQIKKMQGSLFQWNKFNTIISGQSINYAELQMYVDSLSSPIQAIQSPDRKEQFTYFKKRTNETPETQPLNQSINFNPSKTFGGSRARVMFPLKNEIDDFQYKKQQQNMSIKQSSREDFKKVSFGSVLPGLQRLTKIFAQNQNKIQAYLQNSNSIKTP